MSLTLCPPNLQNTKKWEIFFCLKKLFYKKKIFCVFPNSGEYLEWYVYHSTISTDT